MPLLRHAMSALFAHCWWWYPETKIHYFSIRIPPCGTFPELFLSTRPRLPGLRCFPGVARFSSASGGALLPLYPAPFFLFSLFVSYYILLNAVLPFSPLQPFLSPSLPAPSVHFRFTSYSCFVRFQSTCIPPLSSFSPTPSPPHFYLPATASGTPRPAAFQYAVRSQKPLFLFGMSFF